MRNGIDILGDIYSHPIYGMYEVIKQEESRNKVRYYRIKFYSTGYEAVAKSKHIRDLLVRDALYYKSDLLGKIFKNTKNQEYRVLNMDTEKEGYFYIEFIDTGNIISRKRGHIIDGLVYDNKGKTISTIYDHHLNKKVKRRSYEVYKAMLNREKTRNSSVCSEWKDSFQSFYTWLVDDELPKHDVSAYDFDTHKKLVGWALDKDLKSKERLYSPDTCCLLPNKLNQDLYYYQNCKLVVKDDSGSSVEINDLFDFLRKNGYEVDIERTIELNTPEEEA